MSAQNSPRKAYELELDARTITGAACLAELAIRREEQWFCRQGERLRRALDRAQAMTPELLKTLCLADVSSPTWSARARNVGLHPRAADEILPKRVTPKADHVWISKAESAR